MDNLKDACTMSCEDWVNRYTDKVEYKFSQSFERQMNILIDKMRNNKYHRFTRRSMRALIIAAIILSFATTAFAVPSSREYIIEKFKDHFSYTVIETGNIDTVEDIVVGYIPEGFELSDINSSFGLVQEYRKNNEWFIINKDTIDIEINFDALDKETKNINGTEYLLFITDNTNGVIWNNGSYTYTVSGNITKEELIKIALETE